MIKIEIKQENAAFADENKEQETARILRKIADGLENGLVRCTYNDINGNPVCKIETAAE